MYTFDFAKPEAHQPERVRTIVPQQALYWMNSPFVAEQAVHVAERPELDMVLDPRERIRVLYAVVYQRAPSPEELRWGLDQISSAASAPVARGRELGPWRYGMGFFSASTGRVENFERFRYFEGGRWQPGPPAASTGLWRPFSFRGRGSCGR